MKKLVLLAISYNEEKHVKFWIDNHKKFVDKIVLVDTGSTDRTVEIAKANGVKVFRFLWEHDFSRAKNFALRCCSIACHPDWIFFLSPDYWVSNSDMKIIREAIETDDFDAYKTMLMHHRGDWLDLKNTEVLDNPNTGAIVLFKDDPYTFYTGKVHETVDSSLIVARKRIGCLGVIRHHDSKDLTTEQGRTIIRKREEYYQILIKLWDMDYALYLALNQIRNLIWT